MIDIDTASQVIADVIASIPGVIDELGSERKVIVYGKGQHKNIAEAVQAMQTPSMLVAYISTDLPSGAINWAHTFYLNIRMKTNADALRLARKIVTGNPAGSELPFMLTEIFPDCEPPTGVSITTSATQADVIEYVQVSFQLLDRS